MKKTKLPSNGFTLYLDGIDDLSIEVSDALFEAGCDDGPVAMRGGRVSIAFNREARTFKEAVFSAIQAVQNAGIGATVLSVDESSVVTQADIARRAGRSKQQIGQYVTGLRGENFPAPVCEIDEGRLYWDWVQVAEWLNHRGIIGDEMLENSRVVAAVNAVLTMAREKMRDAKLVGEVAALVGA